jgi:hypothetical protein
MVAAYAVVLQMLFAGIAVASVTAAAAGSNGDPFVICYGSRGAPVDNPIPADYPRHEQHCVLCSVAASAGVLPAAAGYGFNSNGFVRWPAASGFQPAQHRTPRLSQGPPQTA